MGIALTCTRWMMLSAMTLIMRYCRKSMARSPKEKSDTARQNLTMRMHMRRFTRLTNAFSKKIENHACAVALHSMYYNFVRLHQTLKVSPAMAAGVTERLWEMTDVVEMIEAWEAAEKRAA